MTIHKRLFKAGPALCGMRSQSRNPRAASMRVLTGEWERVEKHRKIIDQQQFPLIDIRFYVLVGKVIIEILVYVVMSAKPDQRVPKKC